MAGLAALPAAAAVAVVAPVSVVGARLIGAKLTTAAGLLIVAAGLWQISGASITSTYADSVAGMVMLGIRASFISGMDLGLMTRAAVGLAGCLVALVAMPSRPGGSADRDPAGGVAVPSGGARR
ncbi:MAG: hypothetical protein ACHP9Z_04865 [Streptosporangiales bacterium]